MSQMTVQIPERSALLWFILSFTGIGAIIYIYLSLSDLKAADRKFANGNVGTLDPILGLIMMFIPILNIFVIFKLYNDINSVVTASGSNVDRPMSGGMIILMAILSFLIIPIFVLLLQWFKWRGTMNTLARM